MTRLYAMLAAAGGGILALLTFGASKKKAGRKEAVDDMKEEDQANAKDVRDRAERAAAEWVPKAGDDVGYRD